MNLAQDDIAVLQGVSRQTINAIENEKYNPSLSRWSWLCMNCSYGDSTLYVSSSA
jgi:DNA-binding XRE family transcriptional regulator